MQEARKRRAEEERKKVERNKEAAAILERQIVEQEGVQEDPVQ